MSKSPDHDFHVINEESSGEEKESTMSVSQIIIKPDEEKIIKVTEIDLKKITELVNKQTLKGYKAGYSDGFDAGSEYHDLFSFSLGVSFGITITAFILLFNNK